MKIKPEPGKHYRIWATRWIRFHEAHHLGSSFVLIGSGSVVMFLGYHPGSHSIAQVLYEERTGWVFIPRDKKIRRNFWRPVRC